MAADEKALEEIVALYMGQAPSFSDEVAMACPHLYHPFDPEGHRYVVGERFVYNDELYKVLQAHTTQASWKPDTAPSLYARVLPGQDGTLGEWVQPDSTNGYAKGMVVTHGGKWWESLVDNNVWEPGVTGTEAQWEDVSERYQ